VTPEDFDRMEQIRSKLYDFVSSSPAGPDADRARAILARMPKSRPTDSRQPVVPPDEVSAADLARPSTAEANLARNYTRAERRGAAYGDNLRDTATLVGDAFDAASVGAYRRARNMISGAVAPEATRAAQATEDQFNAEHPLTANAAAGTGYLLPGGAPVRLAEGITAGVRALGPRAIALGLGSRPVVGAATAALDSGALRAAEDVTQGAPIDASLAKRAGQAALIGGGLGFAGGAIGASGSYLTDKLSGNPARALIQKYGGEVTAASPGRGGAFEEPLIAQGINKSGSVTDAGIGQTARAAAARVRGTLNEEAKALGRQHSQAVEQARGSGQLEGKYDVTDVYENLRKMAQDDVRYPATARATIDREALGPLSQFRDEAGRVTMTADQVNGLRKKLDGLAKFETPTGVVRDPVMADVAGQLRDVEAQTPFQPINERYAQGASELRQAHRALNVGNRMRTGKADDAAEKTITDLVTRRGQNTVTAGKYETPELAALAARRPSLQLPLDSAALLRARGRMQFVGGGGHGGLIQQLRHPARAVAAAAEPIGQRLVLPAARRAAGLGPPPPTVIALPQAVLRAQQAKREMEMDQ
jgi:hypothetical protein